MRCVGLLLACLLTLGCGNAAKGNDPHFMVNIPTPPSIMQLSPDSSPVNAVPFTLTINGANFNPDAVVFWNGNPMSTRFIMPNQLIAMVTATNMQFAGLVQVYVRTGGQNSNTVDFDVTIQ